MKYTTTHECTLLEALAELSPNSSKTTLRSWLKEGRVWVDEMPVALSNYSIRPGQTISIGPKRKFIEGNIEILFEDRDIIIIDKPSGLLTVATAFDKDETAHAILKKYYRTMIYVVHRLDQETSGVMLFARNQKASDKLKEMFESHNLERCYIGVVEGKLQPEKGTWQSYLYEDPNYVVRPTHDQEKGRLSVTHYEVLDSNKNYSRVQFTLETGRKNQIRVHCQAAGHPIAGDKKYGAKSNPFKRLALHAHTLGFHHPMSKKKMKFTSNIPLDFI